MATEYTVQPAHRRTLRAALRHAKRKAKSALSAISPLELTQGVSEAQELDGYCEESLMQLERATGVKLELTNGQVLAARTALRVYGGSLRKQEDAIETLLDEEDSHGVDELKSEAETVAKLLRVLSPQGELPLDDAVADAERADDTGDEAAPLSDEFDPAMSDEADDEPYQRIGAGPKLIGAGDADEIAEADYEIVDEELPDLEEIEA